MSSTRNVVRDSSPATAKVQDSTARHDSQAVGRGLFPKQLA